jgi:hypothetical protein
MIEHEWMAFEVLAAALYTLCSFTSVNLKDEIVKNKPNCLNQDHMVISVEIMCA